MSIDKTLRFTQSRGFFIIKSLYQNLSFYSKKTPASKVGDELRLYLLDRAS